MHSLPHRARLTRYLSAVDHFGVRFPTCIEDVARVLYELCGTW